MKKTKRVRVGPGGFVTCPFCKYSGVHIGNPCAWCAGCHVRYRITETQRSGVRWVVFDPEMRARSMAEAWAMAIAKSGGVRIG